MLFNSIDFAIFLPIVFILYWFVTQHNLRLQNILLITASFIFYGWWDWRFLFLLIFSSMVDYCLGRGLLVTEDPARRKLFLWTSICMNLGLLGFFKYYNFFVASFVDAFTFFGHPFEASTLRVILPVGISFYTFQSMSYGIDCYNRKLEPTRDIISFMAFVSFFPQLVAGPIERARHMLPQFSNKRVFTAENGISGLNQVIWGLFKKVVIADNCAQYCNDIFTHQDIYSSSTLILGAIYFTFQIYCDFSGYSDIALGVARMFGFELMRNFHYPYFSRDIAEFWRRWHISLSTWFRDYLYIPLGGSKEGEAKKIRNTIIVFVVSGFWHGANWTFIVWGLLNAIYILPSIIRNTHRDYIDIVARDRFLPTIKEFFSMSVTFILTVFAWIFFRSLSIRDAFAYIRKIFQFDFGTDRLFIERNSYEMIPVILLFMVAEWLSRHHDHALHNTRITWKTILVIALILVGGSFSSLQSFIYFQF